MSNRREVRARIRLLAVLAALTAVPAALAQQKPLTLDDLYAPGDRLRLGSTPPPGGIEWLDAEHFLWAKESPGERGRYTQQKVNARTGTDAPLFDPETFAAALAQVPGVGARQAAQLARQRHYTLSPAHDALLLTIAGDLYYWRFGSPTVQALTSTAGDEEEFDFSPDGRLVSFVRNHNLHVVDLSGRERALTTEGHEQLLNGKLDWIYQEEIYGRGTFRGYWWSPDSTRLAYLQLDQRPVPEFTVVDHIPYRQSLETTDYPKPGDPNPAVRLGIVSAAGGDTEWAALAGNPGDLLIVNVTWAPDSRAVFFQVQDREQTWLDLNAIDAATGEVRRVLRETTPAWVNLLGPPHFVDDGSFLWLSERSGWAHLYLYRADGTLVRQVTSGPWEVRTVHGIDDNSAEVYYSGTERSHIGLDVYRSPLDGTSGRRLSEARGTHRASFNPALTLYVDWWSDVRTPWQVRVHRADDGREVRVVDPNPVPVLDSYALTPPEFLQVPTRDGFLMEAMLIKPPDFDPSRRYPVYQATYAGPGAPQVRNAWGGTRYLYHQLLAQHGIVVWICDNRTASGKGAQSAWAAYKRLGESELRDIEDGVAWLKGQPWVDSSRIGISGWSYGGFMVSYALTHSTSFAMGIAGGSVTDWRSYDSIYTERYMLTPQNNPEGYARTSPRAAAGRLSGELLLIHGAMDDNVHVQNTLQFAYELQKAGKPFAMMLYPKSRHGVTEPLLQKHMHQLTLDFTLRTLRPAAPGARQTAHAQ